LALIFFLMNPVGMSKIQRSIVELITDSRMLLKYNSNPDGFLFIGSCIIMCNETVSKLYFDELAFLTVAFIHL